MLRSLLGILFLVGSLGKSTLGGNGEDDRCVVPPFINGKVKYNAKSRVFIFKCYKRYRLLGNKRSLCINGQIWNGIPFCAQSGCSSQITAHHGLIVHYERGLRMSFSCADPSHELVGDSVLACDGFSWNGSVPLCTRPTFNPSSECRVGSCLDWTLSGFDVGTQTPTIETGPIRVSKTQFFYLESSRVFISNATATSSEMYTDKVGCVRVEYFMRGANLGSLQIAQVNDGQEPFLLKNIVGEQGNEWKTITVLSLNKTERLPFYFTITAVKGDGYLSDIAIRKIKILKNIEDCSMKGDDDIRKLSRKISPTSCFDRCGTNVTVFKALWTEGVCSCEMDCKDEDNCCSDVKEECYPKAKKNVLIADSNAFQEFFRELDDIWIWTGMTALFLILLGIISTLGIFTFRKLNPNQRLSNYDDSMLEDDSDLRCMVEKTETYDEETIDYRLAATARERLWDKTVSVEELCSIPLEEDVEEKTL